MHLDASTEVPYDARWLARGVREYAVYVAEVHRQICEGKLPRDTVPKPADEDEADRTAAWKDCKHANLASLRRMKICGHDEGTVWNTWSCNVSRHWDCRNSHEKRDSGKTHYSQTKAFFTASVLEPPPRRSSPDR